MGNHPLGNIHSGRSSRIWAGSIPKNLEIRDGVDAGFTSQTWELLLQFSRDFPCGKGVTLGSLAAGGGIHRLVEQILRVHGREGKMWILLGKGIRHLEGEWLPSGGIPLSVISLGF